MIARCSDLFFRYDEADREVIQGLSLTIKAGDLVILAGANGGGKSTLLALLAGLFAPSRGAVEVLGAPMPGGRPKISGQVVLLPQNPDVYILGSLVEEDLLLGLPEDDPAARDRAIRLCGELGLGDCLERPVQTLSFGQRRKLCLASALAVAPKLALLDEPMAGLDFPAAKMTRKILSANKEAGIAQVVATHDLDMVADLADIFILLAEGRIVRQGGVGDVFPFLEEYGVRPPCWWYSNGEPALSYYED